MSASGTQAPHGPAIPPGSGPGPAVPVARPGRRWPRRLAWSALAVVAVLAAAFFGVGGWYFAGQIESGALAVKPAAPLPADNDVRVVAVSGGQVRLRAIGDQPALAKPMLFGIAWPGGFGQLGTAVSVSGSVVTRPLTVTSGPAPRPGQAAALSNAYYLGDPGQALGIPVRDVVVRGPLGALPAWYFPGRGDTFVIAVHGQNGARKDVLRLASIAHQQGFPVLAITYRNDLGVARDPSGYLQYGQTEWRDLQAAAQWSLAHGARHIVLAGQSMGAAIVASFLQHSALAGTVTRVVFDSPMLDLGAVVDYGASQRSLPVTGGAIPGPLVWTAKQIATARFGVNWAATNYLASTSWLKVPALVIQGSADATVPASVPATLRQLKPMLVTVAIFPGAGHLESWNINRPRYTSLLTSFLAPVAP
jgi:uncharacterized protein